MSRYLKRILYKQIIKETPKNPNLDTLRTNSFTHFYSTTNHFEQKIFISEGLRIIFE